MRLCRRSLYYVFLILVISMPQSYACMCVPPEMDVAFGAAQHIFQGKITGENEDGSFKFEIHEIWKGLPGNTIAVFPNRYRDKNHTTSCDSGFAIGKSFLVFTLGDTSGWYDFSCLTKDLETEKQFVTSTKIKLFWHTKKILIVAAVVLILLGISLLLRWIIQRFQISK